GAPAPMDASFLGARVSVKTSLGETHEGVIFTYDATSSALVLEQRKGMDQKVRRAPRRSDTACLRPPTRSCCAWSRPAIVS
ncbi:MAG: hypothetical protein SGPRY_003571, partial [Prymnesium sp.]